MHHTVSLLALLIAGAAVTALVPGFPSLNGKVARAKLADRSLDDGAAALLEAVREGDRERIDVLLRAAVNPDGRDEQGRTPLMLALRANRPDLAKILIAGGADLAAADSRGEAVLAYAVRAGEDAILKALLERGVNPNTRAAGGGRVVAHAAKLGRFAAAKMLLDAGASEASLDSDGSPMIFHATAGGAEWLVHRLLAGGAVSTARSPAGESVLHAAARANGASLVKTFGEEGVNLDLLNTNGESALHLALLGKRTHALPKLLEQGASPSIRHPSGWQPLHLAIQRGDRAAIALLLDHGADPNGEGPHHRTALDLLLALRADGDLWKALLEAGANPNRPGPDERTPLHVALAERNYELARLLLTHGARGEEALYRAVVGRDRETFSFLLAEGVDPNGSSQDPALVAAVRHEDGATLRELLAAGAVPGRPGKDGQTALHLAVAKDRVDLAEILLEAGANANEPFHEPATDAFLAQLREVGYAKWQFGSDGRIYPIMVAADSGNHALAKLLLDHGANTHVRSKKRYYPIGFAARREDVKMMQILLGVNPAKEERLVKVDLSAQRAAVYDNKGKTIFATKISSGKKGFRTRTGEFVITNKIRNHVSTIYEGAKMPYFQRFSCGDFGFHEGYCPGYAASHGCLRVPRGNAYKLWKITRPGDRVVIVP